MAYIVTYWSRFLLTARKSKQPVRTKRPQGLWRKACAAGQQHVFDDWDELDDVQRQALLKQAEVKAGVCNFQADRLAKSVRVIVSCRL